MASPGPPDDLAEAPLALWAPACVPSAGVVLVLLVQYLEAEKSFRRFLSWAFYPLG